MNKTVSLLPLHVAQDSIAFHIPHIVNIPDASHIPETVYVRLKRLIFLLESNIQI